jgi:hypothetical protein
MRRRVNGQILAQNQLQSIVHHLLEIFSVKQGIYSFWWLN